MTANSAQRHIALVTGANRGIGREVCRQLAHHGMTVLLGGRDLTRAEATAQELATQGLDVRAVAIDVSDTASVQTLAATIDAEFGRIDVLINNAAAYVDWSETASLADLAAVHTIFETNLFGAWRTTQELLPLLRRSTHPRIVNVSSGAGSYGDTQFGLITNGGATASYGISKAALNALTVKLAAELSGAALVNAVCPGLTATAPGMEAFGARPIAEGAASVVWAATLPPNGPTGGFFRDGRPIPW